VIQRSSDSDAAAPAAVTAGAQPDIVDGPFRPRQLQRLDEALRAADSESGLTFSVYVGDLGDASRARAEHLHGQLTAPDDSVLIAVSPNQRILEIVTGDNARVKLPDRVCALAALSMTAAFGGGDLTGGLVTGIRMLTDQARSA
jgi:hypothetical protein